MAAATCFYHPDQISSTVCSQCGVPLCAGCVQTVANRPVCPRCVSAIRSRIASEMNTAPPPQAIGNAPANPYAQGPVYGQPQAQRPISAAAGPMNSAGLLLGGVFGALIGIAGAFVLAKIEFYSNFRIGLLNSLVGFGCGYGVLLGCKRGGLVPAILSGVLAFFAMILCEYFLFAAAHLSQVSFADYLSHIGIDWLFIAIGVYGGVRTLLRAAR